MNEGHEKIFTCPEPPAGLFNRIMARIREEEQILSIKKRLFLFSAAVLISAGALIPAVRAFQTEFSQSGLFQFLSLLFSDLRSVIANWRDFGLAILESLPAMTTVALLSATLVFLWSLKHLTQAIKVVFRFPQVINS